MTRATGNRRKGVIAISSHVARGSVGNRAAVFALEMLEYPVWSVPTVLLPWHPGHGPSTRIVAPAEDFAAFLDDLARAPWLDEVGAVISGYLGAPEQAAPIARLVSELRRRNRGLVYLCDPVIGDAGGLYVPEATARAIRDELIPLADIATPNCFELGWLGGIDDPSGGIVPAARRLGPARVLVTSVPAERSTGNMLVTPEEVISALHPVSARAPNGLGDLTSALFLAHVLAGLPEREALGRTTASVFELLGRTIAHHADELTLEADHDCLIRPTVAIRLEDGH